mmetsp:Transcript_6300/g.9152  ORF Transcript_6300/g.9152 Transcript_6300/m.9152 type:complete len:216 (+) Transcript_6300:127-774(+)
MKIKLLPGPIGLTFDDVKSPPTIHKEKEYTPYSNELNGSTQYYVVSVSIPGQIELTGMTLEELMQTLKDFSTRKDRIVVLTTNKKKASIPFVSKVTLPACNTHIKFKKLSNPPVISRVYSDSPLHLKVKEGHIVTDIAIPFKENVHFSNSSDLSRILKESSAVEGRVMTLKRNEKDKIRDLKSCKEALCNLGFLGIGAILCAPFFIIIDGILSEI